LSRRTPQAVIHPRNTDTPTCDSTQGSGRKVLVEGR
jgi:hypothetical protein